jgi:hypothetical protein
MKKRSRSRREFLGLTGASVAGLASGSFAAAKVLAQTENAEINPHDADLVVFNAKVYTVDPRSPRA